MGQQDGRPDGLGSDHLSRGQEIRGGKITDRTFAPVSISGYLPDVLGTIKAAGSTVIMDQGTCGKGHKEYIPNSSGGPHLLLRASLG
jgi:TldD protein